MDVMFLSDMKSILFKKSQICIKFDASAYYSKVYRRIEITAPFLLVPLRIGERGFRYGTLLNTLIANADDPLLQEFLERAAFGNSIYWLKQLFEGVDLSTLVQRLRARQRKIEPFRAIAWDLKRNGFAKYKDKLLVVGFGDAINMGYLYIINLSTQRITRNFLVGFYPQMIPQIIRTSVPFKDAAFQRDRVFRQNLKRAYELKVANEQILTNIIAKILKTEAS